MDDLVSLPTVPLATSADIPPPRRTLGNDGVACPPARVGPYVLGEVLGSGGMGVVYRAEQQEPLRRTVALKLIRRGLDSDRLIARFEAERLALARMSHSGIARVLDAGATEDGRPYFVMELVDGLPITEFCDARRLTVPDRLALYIAACRAIQHAHQKGIVHRDLKPSNILVTVAEGEPAPKVIDFGIAKAVADDGEAADLALTREGGVVGTPEYMSPEQAGLVQADVDTRADVYALGVLLFELLAGRKPYRLEMGTRDELRRILTSRPTVRPSTTFSPVRARRRAPRTVADAHDLGTTATARRLTPERLRRLLAGDLDTIVVKAMAFDPARRYGSVDQLADDVERYLAGKPVLARPDSWTYRTRKFVARHRLAVGLTAAAAAALVAFAALTAVQARRVGRERDRAEAVNRFLVGMFEDADPTRALGARLTAVEVIERGATRLQHDLADQPETRSALLLTLAHVHRSLGSWRQANALAEQAVALRAGSTSDALADALVVYGDTARLNGGLADAEAAITRAIELREQRFGSRHLAVAEALHHLGLIRHEQGRDAEAEALHRRVLEMREHLGAPEDVVVSSLSELGLSLRSQSRFAEAETIYRDVLASRRRLLPADHPRTLGAMRQLAQVLNYLGKNADAEALFRDALARADRVLGPDHPDAEGIANDLASLLHDRGRLAAAEPLYVRAMRASRLNSHTVALAQQLNNLATLYEDLGRTADALPLYRESLALRRAARGERHALVATALNNLGRLTATLGDVREGERLLREALSIRLEANGEEHALTGRTRYNIGRVLRMRGALDESLEQLNDAMRIQEARLPARHPHTLQTRLERARTHIARRSWHEAELDARTVLDARTQHADIQPWELAEARLVLALALPPERAHEARTLAATAHPVLSAAGPARGALAAEAVRAIRRLHTPASLRAAERPLP